MTRRGPSLSRLLLRGTIVVAAAIFLFLVLNRDRHEAHIMDWLETNRAWIEASEIRDAVLAQNEAHRGITPGEIARLDGQWREEKAAGGGPLIESYLARPLSVWLRGHRDEAGGAIADIFVIDAFGLNVGQTDPTTDLMQADERKWPGSFEKGPGAVFIDRIEDHDGTRIVHVTRTLDDGAGHAIGAITFGFWIDSLR